MNTKTWLDYVTAIGSVATPIVLLILTGVGWRIRTRLQRRFDLEDKLRENRIETYNHILEPFVILLTSDAAWESDPKNKNRGKNDVAGQKLLSIEYRQQAFQLALVGSDAVVKSYNNLMQFFFRGSEHAVSAGEIRGKEMMSLLGQFLLEIRKSFGNETTSLNAWDMLEWFLKDAREYRS